MRHRLQEFMKSEGLTSSKFAEATGVGAANISHLISGRNNPGYEFISRMLTRFPNLNPDWLILGVGNMYRLGGSNNNNPIQQASETEAGEEATNKTRPNELPYDSNQTISEPANSNTKIASDPMVTAVEPNYPSVETENIRSEKSLENTSLSNDIERVIIFFADGTFINSSPRAGQPLK